MRKYHTLYQEIIKDYLPNSELEYSNEENEETWKEKQGRDSVIIRGRGKRSLIIIEKHFDRGHIKRTITYRGFKVPPTITVHDECEFGRRYRADVSDYKAEERAWRYILTKLRSELNSRTAEE